MKKVFLLSLCGVMISCVNHKVKEEPFRTVRCDTVRVIDHSVELSKFSGKVKAVSEANIAFRVAGQILTMNVTEGQFVRKGTVLAQLDDRDYQIQLSATEAEYNRLKAEADRVIELYNKKSVSPNDYDKAMYGLQQITAKLDAHRNTLSYAKLLSPFDGYIEKKHFDRGETVGAGTPVVSMISTDTPEIEINIPTTDFIKREHYESATATIEAFPGKTFKLQLLGINHKANLNQLYSTRFRILDSALPAPGMTAMVTIQYKSNGRLLMQVPVTALVENNVWIVTGETVVKKAVKVIEITTDGRALVEGLKEGEVVVSAGVNSLKEGQQVKVLPQMSNTNKGGLL